MIAAGRGVAVQRDRGVQRHLGNGDLERVVAAAPVDDRLRAGADLLDVVGVAAVAAVDGELRVGRGGTDQHLVGVVAQVDGGPRREVA